MATQVIRRITTTGACGDCCPWWKVDCCPYLACGLPSCLRVTIGDATGYIFQNGDCWIGTIVNITISLCCVCESGGPCDWKVQASCESDTPVEVSPDSVACDPFFLSFTVPGPICGLEPDTIAGTISLPDPDYDCCYNPTCAELLPTIPDTLYLRIEDAGACNLTQCIKDRFPDGITLIRNDAYWNGGFIDYLCPEFQNGECNFVGLSVFCDDQPPGLRFRLGGVQGAFGKPECVQSDGPGGNIDLDTGATMLSLSLDPFEIVFRLGHIGGGPTADFPDCNSDAPEDVIIIVSE